VFDNVAPDEEIYIAIRIDTDSPGTDPSDLSGDVVFQGGSDLTADDFPNEQQINSNEPSENKVLNLNTGIEEDDIPTAVDNADPYDTLRIGDGTYDLPGNTGSHRTLDVKGLTLEGPNAGIDGANENARGDEATINGPLMIGADDVTVDGLKINDSDSAGTIAPETLPGPGAVQLAAGAGYGETADGATLRNNVIEAGVDSDESDEDYGLYTTNVVDVVISRNKFTEDTPAASLYNTGTSLMIEFSNNVDETTNADSLKGQAIPQDTVVDTR
jgi:hypothetical protein